MNITFSGTRGLLLGGTCELALALAVSMIKSSLFPILTYRSNEGLHRIRHALPQYEKNYDVGYLNLGDRDSLQALFTHVGSDLDFLVDFAQGNYESLIAQADEAEVYRYCMENISFRAEILKTVGRTMLKKRKGRLVFVSSTAAQRPNPGQGLYAAGKLASEALYRTMGLEMGGRGITTVILRPGYVEAGRGRVYIEEQEGKVLQTVPIKRAVTQKEIAETILFLLSDSAASLNATVITMDGGLTHGK